MSTNLSAAYHDAMRLEAFATALAVIVEQELFSDRREHVAAHRLSTEIEEISGRLAGALREMEHDTGRQIAA